MNRERAMAALAGVLLLGLGFALGWIARGPSWVGAGQHDPDSIGSAARTSGETPGESVPRSDGGVRTAGARGTESDVDDPPRSPGSGDVAIIGASGDPARTSRASSGAAPSSVGPIPPDDVDAGAPSGRLAASVIQQEVRSHREELGFCFAWQLHQHPDLRGRLTMDFAIGADGRVVRAEVAEDELDDETVARCFRGVTERMRFPAPEGGGEVRVRYPFDLSPGDPPPERRAPR